MKIETTFGKVPLYGLFTTGPGNNIYVKISISGTPNAISLNYRRSNWIPDNRLGYFLDSDEILKIKNIWS